jgi:hypothetical protein
MQIRATDGHRWTQILKAAGRARLGVRWITNVLGLMSGKVVAWVGPICVHLCPSVVVVVCYGLGISWLLCGIDCAYMPLSMKCLEFPGDRGAVNVVRQTEFPLRVSVCAWCKPRDRGASIGAMSHGICPRHFREMRIELQISRSGGDAALGVHRSHKSRERGRSAVDARQLRFPFPAPASDSPPHSSSVPSAAHL